MQAVNTTLTRLLGIRVPVVSAAMAFASSAELAVEVTRGGGFGFVGAAFATPDSLRAELAYTRNSFPELGDKPLPIGIGFIGWLLDANEEQSKQLIDIVLENNVQAIWLAFGVDLYRWIHYIRTSPANARASHKPLIFLQATSLKEALVAVNEWKVDVVIAQGNEAGGHGGSAAPSTMVILSELLAALPAENAPLSSRPAASQTDLRSQHTSLLVQPAAIQRAQSTNTVRTHALDWAWNIYSWPEGIDGRGIRTKIVDDIEAGVPHETVREKYAKAAEVNDPDYMVTWCSQGVSLMKEIKPAKEVMEELHADIVRSLRRGQSLLA
ncbi:hypothetical protein BD414DRAFT_534087 [Trametes punicea]|nr:hypothetical protein BD414DRAFT_534087 [Trametes punicea]